MAGGSNGCTDPDYRRSGQSRHSTGTASCGRRLCTAADVSPFAGLSGSSGGAGRPNVQSRFVRSLVTPPVGRRLSARDGSGDRSAGYQRDLSRRRRAPVTVQQFLDTACRVWRCPPPLRVPFPLISAAAWLCERGAAIAGTPSPLTSDFVRLGRVPHWGDTRRAREELIPQLTYPTLESGLSTL